MYSVVSNQTSQIILLKELLFIVRVIHNTLNMLYALAGEAYNNWCAWMSEIIYFKGVPVAVCGTQAIVNEWIFFEFHCLMYMKLCVFMP